MREDRILDEAHATGGDVRRICDLFGITVGAAIRYTATVDPPSFVEFQLRTCRIDGRCLLRQLPPAAEDRAGDGGRAGEQQ